MLIRKVLASYTFRFLSVYVFGLSMAVLVVMVVLYGAFSYTHFKDLSANINQQMTHLETAYREGGAEAVRAFVRRQRQPGVTNRYFYLLADEEFRKLAGSLQTWPKYRRSSQGWLRFQLDVLRWDGRPVDVSFLARSKELDNGHHLLVARHIEDAVDGAKMVAAALLRSTVITILLGTISGAVVAWMSVRQIDHINRSLQRIMSGDLSERISPKNQHGEIWALSSNVNQMLDRIQALMQGMRQVSDNIAHDLRTPLMRLRNHLGELQQQVAQTRNEDTVQALIDEADAILATFNALLRIARVESGSRRAAFAPLDLNVILYDVMELYEPLAADKAITMTHEFAEHAMIEGDRDLLFQALTNVIDNAIKYTPENGHIDLRLAVVEDNAVITVADSGSGIPEEDMPKVFRRFYRVESSRSEHPGNGLGLSLVWAVTKLHGGEIELSDNRPGLRVDITLKLKPE